MSTTDRQNRLLLAEDWKTIYQSFRYADFQSYDFDNLRRTMINYIRENYPEDFNDYIESSEYLALIDLIAFLGQNLAFRTDLNARENYIELADRRESILRLARLISYNSNRNIAASGLLKFETISTTEDIVDSNGNNLANQSIIWNDNTNPNWYEQFVKILNAALPANNVFGRPVSKMQIDGVSTEQYRFNSNNTDVPVYSFSKLVSGTTKRFEIVSTGIDDDTSSIVEEAPYPGNRLGFLYRDNGQGAGSSNSGFFVHFRQGTLNNTTFAVSNSTPNTIINIDADNINNDDIWLYKLDSNETESDLWNKVSNTEGNNIIYNSISKGIRSIYSVLSRVNNRISLIFSDGTFGELPKGKFKAYYRQSENESYKILPSDLIGINLQIPYLSKNGTQETLNIILELKSVVENADAEESNESIKINAPSNYYTQNRLITAEDYNVGPLSVSQQIIKAKSVNRTSSGISRYYDLKDATGKYSNTLMFGDDGSLYKENIDSKDSFEFTNRTDIEGVIYNQIVPIIKNTYVKNFYFDNFDRNKSIQDLGYSWSSSSNETNRGTGKFIDQFDISVQVSTFTSGIMKFVEKDSLIKFLPPANQYFDKYNNLKTGTPSVLGDKNYIWAKVVSITEDGTGADENGLGPIVFNEKIPNGCGIGEIIPKLNITINDDVITEIIDQTFAYKTFGLRYDTNSREWAVVFANNLNTKDNFSTSKTGDASNQQLDSSWLLLFETNGEKYTIKSRGTRYVFESDEQIRFYFDGLDRIYDSKTGKIVTDSISVLSNNNQPDSLINFTQNWTWQVSAAFRNKAGYVDSKKLELSFIDTDNDGVIDDPDLFVHIVQPDTSPLTKLVFGKKVVQNGSENFNYIDKDEAKITIVETESGIGAYSQYDADAVFYIKTKDIFKVFNSTKTALTLSVDYVAYVGRDKIRFDYVHAAAENRRIDPSSSNIMDVYLLTKNYDENYRKYLSGQVSVKPLPPSSDALYLSYGAEINKIKSVSDEVVYHPVKYKPLFGSQAPVDLQADIKIVKNPNRVVNDNDVKSRTISAINEFFALENWDFGETFYFSELATYIMKQLSPDVSNIVLVPRDETQVFGSLYEIKSENDEIFISAAAVEDVEIIDALTATRLKASGKVVTSDEVLNTGIQSEVTTTYYTGGNS